MMEEDLEWRAFEAWCASMASAVAVWMGLGGLADSGVSKTARITRGWSVLVMLATAARVVSLISRWVCRVQEGKSERRGATSPRRSCAGVGAKGMDSSRSSVVRRSIEPGWVGLLTPVDSVTSRVRSGLKCATTKPALAVGARGWRAFAAEVHQSWVGAAGSRVISVMVCARARVSVMEGSPDAWGFGWSRCCASVCVKVASVPGAMLRVTLCVERCATLQFLFEIGSLECCDFAQTR